MHNKAYNLNSKYIDELWHRLNEAAESNAQPELVNDLLSSAGGRIIPSKEQLTQMIDVAFWTSLSREEGYVVTASIVFDMFEDSLDTFRFDQPILFNVNNLVKLGGALENPRADIYVCPNDADELVISGFKTRDNDQIPGHVWVQALGLGRVLISVNGKSLGALTDGNAVFVDNDNLMRKIIPKLSQLSGDLPDNILGVLRYTSLLWAARAMLQHGRGATLLIVPGSDEWRNSIATPVRYTGETNFTRNEYDIFQKPTMVQLVKNFWFITETRTWEHASHKAVI